jgi:nanoRNase/pAp phosphatase (c-di-AMP/oligoRNAs hydrolase)
MNSDAATDKNAAGYAQELLDFLAKNQQSLSPLLILPHDYPDPDALAAAFALQFLAKKVFQIESRIAYRGIIGRMENRVMVGTLRIPVHRLNPGDLKKFRQVALVDTQPAFENNPFPEDRKAALIIDQHISKVNPIAGLTLVDPGCAATCVILAQALLLQNLEIPPRLATALVYGILSDTLNLYRAERPDVAQIYLRILHWADMRDLARIQNPVRTKSFFITLSRGLQEAMFIGGLVVAHLGPI